MSFYTGVRDFKGRKKWLREKGPGSRIISIVVCENHLFVKSKQTRNVFITTKRLLPSNQPQRTRLELCWFFWWEATERQLYSRNLPEELSTAE